MIAASRSLRRSEPPFDLALLGGIQRVGFAGLGYAGALDDDAQLRAVLVEQGNRGERLVDRSWAGFLAAQQVSPPRGDRCLGADLVG